MTMELTDKAEEILEHLWITTQEKKEAAGLGFLRGDDEEVRMLEGLGMLRLDAQNATLTETGLAEARSCVRRHRLAERLLSDILDGGEDDRAGQGLFRG